VDPDERQSFYIETKQQTTTWKRAEVTHEYLWRPIPFEELHLEQPWESFDISHKLTSKGIDKFVTDYRKAVASD